MKNLCPSHDENSHVDLVASFFKIYFDGISYIPEDPSELAHYVKRIDYIKERSNVMVFEGDSWVEDENVQSIEASSGLLFYTKMPSSVGSFGSESLVPIRFILPGINLDSHSTNLLLNSMIYACAGYLEFLSEYSEDYHKTFSVKLLPLLKDYTFLSAGAPFSTIFGGFELITYALLSHCIFHWEGDIIQTCQSFVDKSITKKIASKLKFGMLEAKALVRGYIPQFTDSNGNITVEIKNIIQREYIGGAYNEVGCTGNYALNHHVRNSYYLQNSPIYNILCEQFEGNTLIDIMQKRIIYYIKKLHNSELDFVINISS